MSLGRKSSRDLGKAKTFEACAVSREFQRQSMEESNISRMSGRMTGRCLIFFASWGSLKLVISGVYSGGS